MLGHDFPPGRLCEEVDKLWSATLLSCSGDGLLCVGHAAVALCAAKASALWCIVFLALHDRRGSNGSSQNLSMPDLIGRLYAHAWLWVRWV